MNRQDRAWVLVYSMVLAALTSVPYVLGFWTQGQDWRFSGFVFGIEDGNSYIAKMLQGSSGAWLFRSPYTTVEQQGTLAFLPYLLLGKLASGAGLHEQLVVLFHLFRILAIPLLVDATYRFISIFVLDPGMRRWGTLMATVGGGSGWLLVALGNSNWLGSLPLDFYSPETFGFLAIFGLPHLVLARALLIHALGDYLRAGVSPSKAWRGGLHLAVLALVQPLSVLSAYAVIGAHQVLLAAVSWRRHLVQAWLPWLKAAVRMVIPAMPLVLFMILAFSHDPFLKAWTAQNVILSPHPAHYLVAYGLLLVPVLMASVRVAKQRSAEGLLALAWFVILPALAYAPHNLQRRLPEGIWVGIIALTVLGLAEGINRSDTRRRIAKLLTALSLPSTILLWVGGVFVTLTPAQPVFLPMAQVRAFDWLRAHADPGSVVLTEFAAGNALPAYAPVRVVVGHGPESIGLEQLLPKVRAFYWGGPETEGRTELLRSHQVSYVLFEPQERAVPSWDPDSATFLEAVYESDGYAIYHFIDAGVRRSPPQTIGIHGP